MRLRYWVLGAVSGTLVCVAGWAVLNAGVPTDWQQDLLPLPPLTNGPVVGQGVEFNKATSKRRRGFGRKKKSRTPRPPSPSPSFSNAPAPTSPAPVGPTETPSPAASPPPPPAPPAVPPAPSTGATADRHYQTGVTHLQQRKVSLAIAELEKCIAVNPKHALAYRALGMAHTILGRQKTAIQAFEKFVQLAPNHSDTPKLRALIEEHHRNRPR